MDEIISLDDQVAGIGTEAPSRFVSKRLSPLSNYVIRLGLAKDAIGAQKVLLGVAVLCVFVASVLLFTLRGPEPVPPSEVKHILEYTQNLHTVRN